MTTTIYLDDGWSITQYDNIHDEYALRHTHDKGITYIDIDIDDPPVCVRCQQAVPEHIIGFYNLCKWKI